MVRKFLLAGYKFMLEMHLRQPQFMYSACGPFTKNKENYGEIHEKFIKENWIKLAFIMTCLMGIFRICLEEQLLIKYYVIKHLILLKIQNLIDI